LGPYDPMARASQLDSWSLVWLYPFQNEIGISNREGSLFLYVTRRLRRRINFGQASDPGFIPDDYASFWIGIMTITSLRNGAPHRGVCFGMGIWTNPSSSPQYPCLNRWLKLILLI